MVDRALRLAAALRRPAARLPRIALYSHDTMGLGHRRRNLLIAEVLGRAAVAPVTLTVSGATDAGNVAVPPGVDSLVLPAIGKIEGAYRSRRLALELDELVAIRSNTIRAALEAFEPDLLIVDNVPRGAVGELDEALAVLRATGRTRCVLGLRDILDEPEAVRRQWRDCESEAAIRDLYDEVWVYGDPAVYDLRRTYGLAPDILRKVRFTGYLDPRERRAAYSPDDRLTTEALAVPPGHQLAVCLVGGGEDGGALVDAFVRARLPERMVGIVVTGPLMPEAVRREIRVHTNGSSPMRVVKALEEPTRLLRRADRVVMMGGYNSTCEVLAFERPALIVPRVTPRQEQLIRAERLQALGLVDMLSPNTLGPQSISDWLARPVSPPCVHGTIDMGGLTRVSRFVDEMLARPMPRRVQFEEARVCQR